MESSGLPPPLPPSSPSPPNSSPGLVTSDLTSHDLGHPNRAAALTPGADDLGIEARGGVWDVSELGVHVLHPENSGEPFSKLEPLHSAPPPVSDETTGAAGCFLNSQGDATPENCLLAVQKIPPLDEAPESANGCGNTSPKMVYDDDTALKQVAQQAAAADSRQGPPPQGGQTQHRDHTSVSLGPAEEASGCSTSWQDQLEAARLAAYPPPPNPQPLPPGKSFHVFFSYCWRDAAWVRHMVDVLEREQGLRCCYHERDFKPGARIIENINLHIEKSVKTALVVTPAFLESEWCSYEAEVVMHLSVDQRRRLLVPVLLEDCQLPGALRPLTYIDATKPAFLDRFLAAILDPDESVHDRPLPLGRTDFFFNPNFYNLDHLCDVTSKWRCCQGETICSPYLPEVLMNRGLTMTMKEHGKIIEILKKASFTCCSRIYDHWLCFLFSICLVAFGLFLFIVVAVMGVGRENYPGIVVVAILLFLVLPFFLTVFPCCKIAFGRRRRLRKAMIQINGIYFRRQLMAGLVTRQGLCRRLALQLKVYYFNPRPCLDHLARRPSPSTQGSESEDDQLLDAGWSTQITKGERSAGRRGQSSASASDVELLTPGEDVEEPEETSTGERQALQLLLSYSGDYMRDYIDHKLPACQTPRHVRQVPCLCQYVEKRIADRNAPSLCRRLRLRLSRPRRNIQYL